MASGNEGVGTNLVVHIQEQLDQLQKMVLGLNASMVGAGLFLLKVPLLILTSLIDRVFSIDYGDKLIG